MVDFDVVDESNLHRQVLFGRSSVGRPKIQAATDRLRDLNPHIKIVPHELRLDSSNALELFKDYDIVVDGHGQLPDPLPGQRRLRAAGQAERLRLHLPLRGAGLDLLGRARPLLPLPLPEPPPPGLVPSCAEGGVLGVLPGIIGSLQANEVIKLIVGVGDPMIGRLLLFDALKMKFRELKLRKDPSCPICSEHPTQTGLIDYDQFCGVEPHGETVEAAFEISAPSSRPGWTRVGR